MELSVSQLRELICPNEPKRDYFFGQSGSSSLKIGQSYLIRTVTLYYLGRLVSITETDLVLEEASWIPDTGRFSNFLKTGIPNECEPFNGSVIIFKGGLIDASEWNHKLPSEQK